LVVDSDRLEHELDSLLVVSDNFLLLDPVECIAYNVDDNVKGNDVDDEGEERRHIQESDYVIFVTHQLAIVKMNR
jgi:hypothetical protein